MVINLVLFLTFHSLVIKRISVHRYHYYDLSQTLSKCELLKPWLTESVLLQLVMYILSVKPQVMASCTLTHRCVLENRRKRKKLNFRSTQKVKVHPEFPKFLSPPKMVYVFLAKNSLGIVFETETTEIKIYIFELNRFYTQGRAECWQ